MNAIQNIKERRSIRKFKDELIDTETMEDIIDIARFAPSWANTQIARYTFITNKDVIEKLANDGVRGFVYNMKTLKEAKNVVVLSFIKGKSLLHDQVLQGLMPTCHAFLSPLH